MKLCGLDWFGSFDLFDLGPVSTTLSEQIASQFAGQSGQLIEMYPIFSKKGLDVSCLSDFPEEQEVLFIDCTFQIANIHYSKNADYKLFAKVIQKNDNWGNDKKIETAQDMLSCFMRAIQVISINSRGIYVYTMHIDSISSIGGASVCDSVISLNDTGNASNHGFHSLSTSEKICILHLLYLQNRPKESVEWKQFVDGLNPSNCVRAAMERCREMFSVLATNVRAIRMEKLSKSLEEFFCTPMTSAMNEYNFPYSPEIGSGSNSATPKSIEEQKDEEKEESMMYISLQLDTLCLLFPNAEQISINAEHWDFSLEHFIAFLKIFNSNYEDAALQDIYIRFVSDSGRIFRGERQARKARKQFDNFKENQRELRRLGWIFQTPSHLHRVGVT